MEVNKGYMPNWLWMILLQVVLILLNAVFAGSEIAVLSVNEFKLKKLTAQKNRRAIKLEKLIQDPSRFLSVIQIAITLSGFLGSAFAADNFSGALADWMAGLGIGLPYDVLDTIAVIVITIILSYFTLVFGELVPKQIAIHKSEQMALAVSGLLNAIAILFSPLVKVLTWSTNGVLRLLHINPEAEGEEVSEEEIIMMVNAGEEKGTIDPEEKELIEHVFAFDDREAKDIMVHRTDMSLMDLDDPDSWESVIYDNERSFIPVYEKTPDHIAGILNVKKFFRNRSDLPLKEKIVASLGKPVFVWENMKADELFAQMKREHQNMVIVLDEYGGVSGLITLNDLVSELVGDFEDDDDIIENPDGTCTALGSARISDINSILGTDVDEKYGTLNGLVYALLDSVPENGLQHTLSQDDLQIEIKKVNHHRIEEAILSRMADQPDKDQD